MSTIKAQDRGEMTLFNLVRHDEFFIPGFIQYQPIQYHRNVPELKRGIIFKSPIQHRAIFCRLEDISQKKMKIVFQIHLGDYNSKMDMVVPR